MTGQPPQEEAERRLRNLQAVARHHVSGAAAEGGDAAKPRDSTSAWKRRLATWGPIGVVLAFVLGKGKLLLGLLKVTKLSTLLTMFLMVWVYATLWGLPFALGFVLLIFVHEMGHAVAMQQQGIRAGAPVFIPFVGAVIAMRSLPRNAYVEAVVGIGGPLLGSAGALVCLVIGWISGSLFWYALASTGFLLNLFNLIPISPLDGGRIVGVISRWIWVAGYAVAIGVFFITWSPMVVLILLLGLMGLSRSLRGPREGYFEVAPGKRVAMGAAYFALIALLALGMWAADAPLEPLRSEVAAVESAE
jgi:Zn-dependent protease